MDPSVWSDPEVFRPERFIDEDGKLVGRDRIVPFGLGWQFFLPKIIF